MYIYIINKIVGLYLTDLRQVSMMWVESKSKTQKFLPIHFLIILQIIGEGRKLETFKGLGGGGR